MVNNCKLSSNAVGVCELRQALTPITYTRKLSVNIAYASIKHPSWTHAHTHACITHACIHNEHKLKPVHMHAQTIRTPAACHLAKAIWL